MGYIFISVCAYEVSVYTGSKFGSGTDANVHIEIHGERGDTGPRKLLVSKKDGNKFENGKVCLSYVSYSSLSVCISIVDWLNAHHDEHHFNTLPAKILYA